MSMMSMMSIVVKFDLLTAVFAKVEMWIAKSFAINFAFFHDCFRLFVKTQVSMRIEKFEHLDKVSK